MIELIPLHALSVNLLMQDTRPSEPAPKTEHRTHWFSRWQQLCLFQRQQQTQQHDTPRLSPFCRA
ncbi:hypothetical protein [Atopomonas sediminilitoris]|uniref:hypothetical protein n=1 Tax=Atopomonas sediminilitoris TaxID=2919919 RepID=UPI001F4E7248|nr:hypothetical protein [Atopomonas sediminilitoris]MCJ8167861.1 hypothetical protein [Atopomonas sediminilitoris]